MKIPFVGGCYLDRSPNLNGQRSQNLYPVVDKQDGKSIISLMNIPGLTAWLNLGESGHYVVETSGNMGMGAAGEASWSTPVPPGGGPVAAFAALNNESGPLVKLLTSPLSREGIYHDRAIVDDVVRPYGLCLDAANRHAYMGVNFSGLAGYEQRIVKVDASAISYLGKLVLSTSATLNIQALSKKPENGFLYVTVRETASPYKQSLYQIRLSDLTVIQSTPIFGAVLQSNCLYPDATRGYLYYLGNYANTIAIGEAHAIPGVAPYTVAATYSASFISDIPPVRYAAGGNLTRVTGAPGAGEYTCSAAGVFTFSAADAGKNILLDYTYWPGGTPDFSGKLIRFSLSLFGDDPTSLDIASEALHWGFSGAHAYDKSVGKLFCCYPTVGPVYYPAEYSISEVNVDTMAVTRTLALPVFPSGRGLFPARMAFTKEYIYILGHDTSLNNPATLLTIDRATFTLVDSQVLGNGADGAVTVVPDSVGYDLGTDSTNHVLAVYSKANGGADSYALYRAFDISSGIPSALTDVCVNDAAYVESGDFASNLVVGDS